MRLNCGILPSQLTDTEDSEESFHLKKLELTNLRLKLI